MCSEPDPAASSPLGRELFRRELRELGYVEGKNIAFEYRSADNKLDRLPALADELVRLKVDVLVTPAPTAAQLPRTLPGRSPSFFYGGGDPVAAGLVDSLARPGGNITGFTNIGAVLAGKRLELLKETIPKLSRVAVLWNPQDPSSAQQWKESQLPARELGLQLHSMEVSSADKFESAFKEAIKAGSAALAVTSIRWPFLIKNGSRTWRQKSAAGDIRSGRFCRQRRLDVLRSRPGRTLQARRVYVDKILKGAKPADLPVEQPTKFELIDQS